MTASEIDDAIIRAAEQHWQKAALVITRAARILYGDLPDGEGGYQKIGERLSGLVDSGRLQAQGDIARWRFSEVRKVEA